MDLFYVWTHGSGALFILRKLVMVRNLESIKKPSFRSIFKFVAKLMKWQILYKLSTFHQFSYKKETRFFDGFKVSNHYQLSWNEKSSGIMGSNLKKVLLASVNDTFKVVRFFLFCGVLKCPYLDTIQMGDTNGWDPYEFVSF